jgi:hypothetical protein
MVHVLGCSIFTRSARATEQDRIKMHAQSSPQYFNSIFHFSFPEMTHL